MLVRSVDQGCAHDPKRHVQPPKRGPTRGGRRGFCSVGDDPEDDLGEDDDGGCESEFYGRRERLQALEWTERGAHCGGSALSCQNLDSELG